jgi:hypothetical protein
LFLPGTHVQAEPPPPPPDAPPDPYPGLVLDAGVPPPRLTEIVPPDGPVTKGALKHSSPVKPNPEGNPHIFLVVLGGTIKSISPSSGQFWIVIEFMSASLMT